MSDMIPVACCIAEFSKDQRREYGEIWSRLEARCVKTRELEEGLELHFPGDSDTLRLLSGWVNLERLCCPFLTFTIVIGREEERLMLRLTGSGEAKAYLLGGFLQQIRRVAASPEDSAETL